MMNKLAIVRVISVVTGAAVLFGLERGLGLQLYVAFPAAMVAYMVVKVAIGLLWGVDERA
jgi:hypothetical protein